MYSIANTRAVGGIVTRSGEIVERGVGRPGSEVTGAARGLLPFGTREGTGHSIVMHKSTRRMKRVAGSRMLPLEVGLEEDGEAGISGSAEGVRRAVLVRNDQKRMLRTRC